MRANPKVKPFALLVVLFCGPRVSAQPALADQWKLFERAGADNSKYQCFTKDNVSVKDGNLVIETRKEPSQCGSFDLPQATYPYTSGFIAMRRFNFLYGTVSVRAKVGGGRQSGAWPVIWMADASCQPSDPTGTDDACNEEEIDIAELLGGDFHHLNQQIHTYAFRYNDGCKPAVEDLSQDFHLYELNWSAGLLVFRLDGVSTCRIEAPYVPDAPMYLKINVYAGGWGGPVNEATLPWTTLVDYVKVTQNGKVIFNDGFGPEADSQPVTVTTKVVTGAEASRFIFRHRRRWAAAGGAVVLGAATLIWLLRRNRQTKALS
jgi:beta-glucanase (GH16 family)